MTTCSWYWYLYMDCDGGHCILGNGFHFPDFYEDEDGDFKADETSENTRPR
jgi:hypothetical protein